MERGREGVCMCADTWATAFAEAGEWGGKGFAWLQHLGSGLSKGRK